MRAASLLAWLGLACRGSDGVPNPGETGGDTGGIPVAPDADGDGVDASLDCDDGDPAISPLAEEVPYDGVDQDCDGADLTDVDGDGWEAGDDCDDVDPAVSPGVEELCGNGVDDDCSGTADDRDADGDGHLADSCGGGDPEDLTRKLTQALDATSNEILGGELGVGIVIITDEDISEDGRTASEVVDDWTGRLDEGGMLFIHGMAAAPGDDCDDDESDWVPILVEETGGAWMSICARDVPGFFSDLLAAQAVLHRTVPLSAAPDPDATEVTVDGAVLDSTSWAIDGSTVVLSSDLPLAPGAEVGVRYREAGCE